MGTHDAVRGWIFELDPAELLSLPRQPSLKEIAVARLRRRWLEGFCDPLPQSAPEPHPSHAGDEVEAFPLSAGVARGRARVVRTADEAGRLLRSGEILVTEEIRPAFTSVLPRASALVCRHGTPLSHAAIVARELGIPAVSFAELARIQDGAQLTVDGDRGRLRLMSVPEANIEAVRLR
ncbi:MAG: PEP-utilizing enzyme [Myxococcales bacterium]